MYPYSCFTRGIKRARVDEPSYAHNFEEVISRPPKRVRVTTNSVSSSSSSDISPTPIPAPESTQSSALLSLPGELRNQIYALASEETPIHMRHAPRKRSTRFYKTCLWKWDGLTQVCRQIRAEYRPIYMRKTLIHINLRDVHRYLQDFYPGLFEADRRSDEVKDYQANLVIELRHLSRAGVGEINILPLIKLVHQASDVRWRFTYDSAIYNDPLQLFCADLGLLLDQLHSWQWNNLFRANLLSAVTLYWCNDATITPFTNPRHSLVEKNITVKFDEKIIVKAATNDGELFTVGFLKAMGLDELRVWNITVTALTDSGFIGPTKHVI